jgi:hypothetical protein
LALDPPGAFRVFDILHDPGFDKLLRDIERARMTGPGGGSR